jgi:hypothetical protein
MTPRFQEETMVSPKAKYRLKDGTIVPGVTTVLGVLSKNALIHWAWDLGMKGIDYRKFRDDKAAIGTLAHDLVLAHLKKEKAGTSDYSQKQIDQAENSFLSYLEWEKGKEIEPMFLEEPMVSELFRYGGTPDFVGMIDNVFTIMDLKTGGIYDEHYYQICGYDFLQYEKTKELAQQGIILSIPRSEDESFQVQKITTFERGWDVFYYCLKIYNLRKEIKSEKELI